MNEFRSPNVDNITDVLEYMEDSGYADLRNCPDHALALLYFAEHFQFDKIYLDAFAHAVGMYEDVFSSPEYEVRRLKENDTQTNTPRTSPALPAPSSPAPTSSSASACTAQASASPASSSPNSPRSTSASRPPPAPTLTISATSYTPTSSGYSACTHPSPIAAQHSRNPHCLP